MLTVKATGYEDFYKSTNDLFFRKNASHPVRTEPHFKIDKIYVDLNQPRKYVTSASRRRYVRSVSHINQSSPCLGLGTLSDASTDNATKPITRDVTPQEYKIKVKPSPPKAEEKPLMDQSLSELIKRYCMVSTKSREDKPYCLPIPKKEIPDTTLEENADMVRVRPLRREQGPGDWQVAGNAWEHVQLRKNYYNPQRDCVQKIENAEIRAAIEAKRSERREHIPLKNLKEPYLMASICKARQIPGYKGFVPATPVQCRYEPLAQDHYSSVAQRIYRSFPLNALGDQRPLVRPAPMSKTVVLVPPNNPFRNLRCENRSGPVCAK